MTGVLHILLEFQLIPLPPPLSLAAVKSRCDMLVPDYPRVLEYGPLNDSCCCCCLWSKKNKQKCTLPNKQKNKPVCTASTYKQQKVDFKTFTYYLMLLYSIFIKLSGVLHKSDLEREMPVNIRDSVLMHSVEQRVIVIDCCGSIIQTLKMPHCSTSHTHTPLALKLTHKNTLAVWTSDDNNTCLTAILQDNPGPECRHSGF